MKHQVNISIQIVPIAQGNIYALIDEAIAVIHNAGVAYTVGPMETVMQGSYDTLMEVVKRAQEAVLKAGADEVVVTMKVHARKDGDVNWEEKKINRSRLS